MSAIRNIPVRKQAEAQLHLHTTALEAVANAIVITDREGTIIWVNPAVTSLTGYTAQELLGRNPGLLKSGHHDTAFYRHLWAQYGDTADAVLQAADAALYRAKQGGRNCVTVAV